MYFEEGAGKKDTVYLGYDTAATYYAVGIDTVFGEKWIITDTINFYAYTETGFFGPDSILLVDIQPNLNTAFGVSFKNGILPVKIWWDNNLFYSDSLPYADQFPEPRAQGLLDYNTPMWTPGCSYQFSILLGDTCYQCLCYRTDTVEFVDQFSNPNTPIGYIVFWIEPWTGINVGIANNEAKEPYRIFPNPVLQNKITIEFESEFLSEAHMYDILGRKVKISINYSRNRMEINTSNLSAGIYTLTINSGKSIFTEKIVIVN